MKDKDFFKMAISATEVFKKFDADSDDRLDQKEFQALCEALFTNGGQQYQLENGMLQELFNVFDSNSDGFICKDEFEVCYAEWIRKIVHPVSVLVVVDVQNDFISGSLGLKKNAPSGHDGKDVVQPINEILDSVPFQYVFYTKDWHGPTHISFIDNVQEWKLHDSSAIKDAKAVRVFDTVVFEGNRGSPVEQTLWPAHCIMDSWGSEFHEDLKIIKNSKVVYKGIEPGIDSYSAFLTNDKKTMTILQACIDKIGGMDVYTCGLALDYCVGGTTIDSLDLGYRTVVIEDATRSIALDAGEKMKEKIKAKNGIIVSKDKVKNMVLGVDRRPELGFHLAQTIKQHKFAQSTERKELFPF